MSGRPEWRRGDLATPRGPVRVVLTCWSCLNGECAGEAQYIGERKALLAAGVLTRSMLARSIALRKGKPLRDEHGHSFRLRRVARKEGHFLLIRDLKQDLPGVRDLFPNGIPEFSQAPPRQSETPIPALARRLERRYAGVTVKCHTVFINGSEHVRYTFSAKNVNLLIGYRLAKRGKGSDLIGFDNDCEVRVIGHIDSEGTAHAHHFMTSHEPVLTVGRTYPPKKTIVEVARIWKRITGPQIASSRL